VEESEARDAQHDKTEHRIHHLECVFKECLGIVEDPIYQEATEKHNQTIDQEDTPVRQ
jgi:hypothetical protein